MRKIHQFADAPSRSRYGAQMGRASDPGLGEPCKVSIFRVRMVDGDYDDGGAYWGGYPCDPLYCARNEEHNVELFYRAKTRSQAVALLRSHYAHLTPRRLI